MDKRRFFSKPYIVFFIILFVLLCISKDVIGANWKFVGQTEEFSWYYDAESINLLQNDIRVLVKYIPNDEDARLRYLESRQKKQIGLPDNYSHSLFLYEVNCEDKTIKTLIITEYTNEEEIIKSENMSNPAPIYTVPGSIGYKIQKTICSLKDSKKKRR